jgi:hypothetical protein
MAKIIFKLTIDKRPPIYSTDQDTILVIARSRMQEADSWHILIEKKAPWVVAEELVEASRDG